MPHINIAEYPDRLDPSAPFENAAAWVEFVQIGVGIPGKVVVRVYKNYEAGMSGGAPAGFFEFNTGVGGFPTLAELISTRPAFAQAYQTLTQELAVVAADHIEGATIVTE